MPENLQQYRQAYRDALRDMSYEFPEVVPPAIRPVAQLPLDERCRKEMYRHRAPNAELLRVLRVYNPFKKYNIAEQDHGYVFIEPRNPEHARACKWPAGIERLLHLNSEKDIAYCAGPDGKIVELRYLGKNKETAEVLCDAVLTH
jgi:hypothetical protein